MTTHPTTIQRYQVVRRLAQGGMGALYLAWDPALKRQVAIKILMHDEDELRERFAREAQSAASLDHPHIVTVYDVGEVDGRPFIAMEYIRGETLAEIIRTRKPLPVTRKLALIEELCSGLHFAHRAGIVHRDVKPSNAIVDDQGSLKVLDFGIARIAESSGMTQAGMLVGTLNYISPEQMVGQPADSRSDIFSVGVVCYELLAYRQAFPGGLESGVLNKILQARPDPPLETACPDLDLEIIRIVEHALEKQPTDRYQNLEVMERDLRRVRRRLETGSHPVPDTKTMSVPRRVDREEIARRRATQIQGTLDSARKAFESGDYESAVVRCEETLLLDPEQADAIEILDRARTALDERQAEEWLNDAEGQFRVGALSAAQALVDRALSVDPTSTRGTSIRNAVEAALRERDSLRRRTDALKNALDRAHMNFDRGLFQEAMAAADEVLALDAGSAEAQAVKARSAEAMAGREREAIERRARETVREAQRLFNAGSHTQALEILQRFDPPHELVSNTLATLRPEAERIAEERRLEAERRARQGRISTELTAIRGEMARREFASAVGRLRRLEQKEESTPEITLLIQEAEAGIARENAAKLAREIDELIRSSAPLLDRQDYDGASAKVDAALKLDARNQSALAQQSRIQAARQAEIERRAAEKREAERREAARLEAERQEAARREAERVAALKREAEQREAEKRAAAKREAERQEAARREAERQEAARREAERREAERVAALKRETEQREAEKRAAAKREAERQEAARREAERQEAARREAERREAERVAALKREAEQREAEKRAAAKREAERQEAARREAARREAEQPTALLERGVAAKSAAPDAAPTSILDDRTIIRTPDDRTIVRMPDDRTIVRTPDDRTIVRTPDDRTIIRTLDDRTIVSAPDDRTIVSAPDDRTIVSAPDDRTIASAPDDRTIVRPPADRTLVRWPSLSEGPSAAGDVMRQDAAGADPAQTMVIPPKPPPAVPVPGPAPVESELRPPSLRKPGLGSRQKIQPLWIGAAVASVVLLIVTGLLLRSPSTPPGTNQPSGNVPPPPTPDPFARLMNQAEDQLTKGLLPDALSTATEALKLRPTDDRPKNLLERILKAAMDKVEQARQSARDAGGRRVTSNKSFSDAERIVKDQGRLSRQGNTAEAIQAAFRASELYGQAGRELGPVAVVADRGGPEKPSGPSGSIPTGTAPGVRGAGPGAVSSRGATSGGTQEGRGGTAAAANPGAGSVATGAGGVSSGGTVAGNASGGAASPGTIAPTTSVLPTTVATTSVPVVTATTSVAATAPTSVSAADLAAQVRRADEAAIREVVRRYAAAYTGLSADGVKQVFPDADEGMLAKTFQQFRLQRVAAAITDIAFPTLTSATVTATWSVHFEPKAGRPSDRSAPIRLTLRKSGTSWLIVGRQE